MGIVAEHNWAVAAGTTALLLVVHLVLGFLRAYVWRPKSILRTLQAQGVSGPTPTLMTGNLEEIEALRAKTWDIPIGEPGEVDHDYAFHLFPHFKVWGEKYGSKFVMWWAEEPAILETDLNLLMEVFGSKYDGAFAKHSRWEATLASVIGQGLAVVNGKTWYNRRHLTQPAFHADKVKELAAPLKKSAQILVEKWEEYVKKAGGECTFDVAPDLVGVAADAICRVAFQTNYDNSHGAFEKQLELLKITFESIAHSFIPLYRFTPTPGNLRRWRLKSDIERILKEVVEAGMKTVEAKMARDPGYVPKDLLALLIAANKDPENIAKGMGLSKQHLLDEMKTFFAAGFDTISATLTFTMLCLADNPVWQERVYEELMEVCDDGDIDARKANKLKVLGMVINETMRLYPPAPQLSRTAVRDVQLGQICIPKGLSVFMCVPMVHRLPEVWGPDANEFKPERFKDGVANSCSNPSAYMPFSFGPRSCVAKTLAALELKIILGMVIRKFKFTLSPTYLHNPIMEGVVIKAKSGVPLILTKRD